MFSVIVTTYHRNDLLALCLDRLAPNYQTLASGQYEVIVTDDGTQTTAEEMIREKYSWAKWVRGPQRGPAANRNSGVRYAQGEWVVFTDDDCLPEKNWLQAFSNAVDNNKELVFEGKTVTDSPNKGIFYTAPVNETGGYLWSCNFSILKTLFFEMEGFDDKFPIPHLEDVDFRERIKIKGFNFLFVEDAVILHPQRPLPPILKQSFGHESSFYLSRKHKALNNGFKLKIIPYLINQLKKILKDSKSIQEGIKFLITRTLIEGTIILFMSPIWKYKYKKTSTHL